MASKPIVCSSICACDWLSSRIERDQKMSALESKKLKKGFKRKRQTSQPSVTLSWLRFFFLLICEGRIDVIGTPCILLPKHLAKRHLGAAIFDPPVVAFGQIKNRNPDHRRTWNQFAEDRLWLRLQMVARWRHGLRVNVLSFFTAFSAPPSG